MMWFLRFALRVKLIGHPSTVHSKIRSLVCCRRCSRSDWRLKNFLQIRQGIFSFESWSSGNWCSVSWNRNSAWEFELENWTFQLCRWWFHRFFSPEIAQFACETDFRNLFLSFSAFQLANYHSKLIFFHHIAGKRRWKYVEVGFDQVVSGTFWHFCDGARWCSGSSFAVELARSISNVSRNFLGQCKFYAASSTTEKSLNFRNHVTAGKV